MIILIRNILKNYNYSMFFFCLNFRLIRSNWNWIVIVRILNVKRKKLVHWLDFVWKRNFYSINIFRIEDKNNLMPCISIVVSISTRFSIIYLSFLFIYTVFSSIKINQQIRRWTIETTLGSRLFVKIKVNI